MLASRNLSICTNVRAGSRPGRRPLACRVASEVRWWDLCDSRSYLRCKDHLMSTPTHARIRTWLWAKLQPAPPHPAARLGFGLLGCWQDARAFSPSWRGRGSGRWVGGWGLEWSASAVCYNDSCMPPCQRGGGGTGYHAPCQRCACHLLCSSAAPARHREALPHCAASPSPGCITTTAHHQGITNSPPLWPVVTLSALSCMCAMSSGKATMHPSHVRLAHAHDTQFARTPAKLLQQHSESSYGEA